MLKIGVLGIGNSGKNHINSIKAVDGYKLKGFYDYDDSLSKSVSKELELHRFNSAEKLIDNVDIVDITLPVNLHYKYAVNAIKKGKHIFVERPISSTVEEAEELIELSREAGVKIFVSNTKRFNKGVIAAKDFIKNPQFIETHRLYDYKSKKDKKNIVYDLMLDDIDIILSVVNSEIKKVSAKGVNVFSMSADFVNARIEFDNGTIANLTVSGISSGKIEKTTFYQHGKYITVDFFNKSTTITDLKNNKISTITFNNDIDKGKQKVKSNETIKKQHNAIVEELKSFKNSLINNTEPIVSIHDGYNALKVAKQIVCKINKTQDINSEL
jgi:predicted dehydrogenase